MLTSLVVVSIAGLWSCDGDPPDPRFATPQATVQTLLKTYGLWQVTFLEARDTRQQPDIDTVARCFWDYDRDDSGSRAMGEFVAGMLAAGQGRLEYDVRQTQALVRTMNHPVFLRKTDDGWLIVLRDTVPEEIRNGLRDRPRRAPDHEMP